MQKRSFFSLRARRSLRACLGGLLFLAGVVLLADDLLADTLVMDDGRTIEGEILEESSSEVKIKTRFGTFTFKKAEIVEIKREKTRDQIYAEKLAAAKTGDDFHALGLWCEENKMRRKATKHYEQAIQVDPDHAGARAKLGFVRYKDDWMTPAERDKRAASDFAAEMKAKGLVEHEGKWVTPDEKKRLEEGLMNLDGVWVTRDEYLRRKGLAERNGELIPREEALAQDAVNAFMDRARFPVQHHVGEQAVLIGMLDVGSMEAINAGLVKTRAWFDETFGIQPGLKIYGGRLPELYVFGEAQDAHFPAAVDGAAERSNFIPEGWVKAVKTTLGFTWIDPVPISGARQGPRGPEDLAGHCYHNMGHILAGRLGGNGKLLPPWYEEGFAAIAEERSHGKTRVFCRSSIYKHTGTQSSTTRADFDEAVMRQGSWRHALRDVLKRGEAQPFDKLARLQFSELQFIDIAQSMAIFEWLESQPGALKKFHAELRRHSPAAPARLHLDGNQRQAMYNAAFQAAVGMDFRRADAAWRKWFLSR